jgi:hypothetical protein
MQVTDRNGQGFILGQAKKKGRKAGVFCGPFFPERRRIKICNRDGL